MLGFFAERSAIFLPHVASAAEIPDEVKLIESRGFRIEANGKRETMEKTLRINRTHAYIYFGMHLCDAYIGRLFVQLSTYLSLQFTQNTSQIVLHLLEIAGERLHEVYKGAFKAQLNILKNKWIPAYEQYMQNGMLNEPQNQAKYLSADPDMDMNERSGIDLTRRQVNMMKAKIDELLQLN